MSNSNADWKIWGETWKDWIRRFWWLRGVAAAMALTALVPKFLDVSRYEFLDAFNAIILGWNSFCEWLGSLIGQLPFLPDLSPALVNTIFFTGAVSLPIFVTILMVHFEEGSLFAKIFGLILASATSGACTFSYYELISLGPGQIGYVELSALFLFIAFFGGGAMLILPGYARGVVYTVGFIITMQILFILNAPWIGEKIKRIPCELSSSPPARCSDLPSVDDNSAHRVPNTLHSQ